MHGRERLERMTGLSGEVHRMGCQSQGGHCREGTTRGEHLMSQQCPTMHWDACGVVHQYLSYLVKHQIVKDLV